MTTVQGQGVYCGGCGEELGESENVATELRKPCPKCNSKVRTYRRTAFDDIPFRGDTAHRVVTRVRKAVQTNWLLIAALICLIVVPPPVTWWLSMVVPGWGGLIGVILGWFIAGLSAWVGYKAIVERITETIDRA